MPRKRRRLGRILLNALTALSLLLCVGTVGLWVRSDIIFDRITFNGMRYCGEIRICLGAAYFVADRNAGPVPSWILGWDHHSQSLNGLRVYGDLAPTPRTIGIRTSLAEPPWIVAINLWVLALVGSTTPTCRAVAYIRRLRNGAAGRCACGYDLTGNASGTCPECGTLVAPVAAAAAAGDAASAAPPGGGGRGPAA